MKKRKMQGFDSHGMVLCAKTDGKVEFVAPPEGAKPGDRVVLEDLDCKEFDVLTPAQVKKKKVWETIAPQLKTGPGGVACFGGKKLVVGGEVCKAPTIGEGAPIS